MKRIRLFIFAYNSHHSILYNIFEGIVSLKKITTKIHAIISDMDGVLWSGNQQIVDIPALFSLLDHKKLPFILATNNSTITIEQYIQKINSFKAVIHEHQIITAGIATAKYLKNLYPHGGPLYIIGEAGLHETLRREGFYQSEKSPTAVVVGLNRSITYEMLKIATILIRNGTQFIATNTDRTLPTPEGLIPGAGAITSSLEASTGQKPIVIGKPSSFLYEVALERLKLPAQSTLVIGDRLETDIAGGQALGCQTALVLSGASSLREFNEWTPKPDFVASDIIELVNNILV
jgi:4-nitrophenyl phosphatase